MKSMILPVWNFYANATEQKYMYCALQYKYKRYFSYVFVAKQFTLEPNNQ